ncbi:MAG: hypothetical protein GY696_40385 [Gammaproteobacteria bacterium]|nr:hypothetical protein [Gammaproteobacteria bacterium]
MVLKYKPGAQQKVADALSRLPPSNEQIAERDELEARQESGVRINEKTAGFLTDEQFWKDKFQIHDPKMVKFLPHVTNLVRPLTEEQALNEQRTIYINVPRVTPIIDDIDDENILPDCIVDSMKQFEEARMAYRTKLTGGINTLVKSDHLDWAAETINDPFYGKYVRFIREGEASLETLRAEVVNEVRQFSHDYFLSETGILYRYSERTERVSKLKLVCVPQKLKHLVL